MTYKHQPQDCETVLKAIKSLSEQIGRQGDENIKHLSDSIIQLTEQLLREPK
jgi:hypothetical protein